VLLISYCSSYTINGDEVAWAHIMQNKKVVFLLGNTKGQNHLGDKGADAG
jgi:hypothetical protein